MISCFIFNYFKYYFLVSLGLFSIILLSIKFLTNNINVDIFELFDEYNKMMEEFKILCDEFKFTKKIYNTIEYVFDESLNGNNAPIIICILIGCLIPFLRFQLTFSILKSRI